MACDPMNCFIGVSPPSDCMKSTFSEPGLVKPLAKLSTYFLMTGVRYASAHAAEGRRGQRGRGRGRERGWERGEESGRKEEGGERERGGGGEGGREGHGKIKESPKEIVGEESETGERKR